MLRANLTTLNGNDRKAGASDPGERAGIEQKRLVGQNRVVLCMGMSVANQVPASAIPFFFQKVGKMSVHKADFNVFDGKTSKRKTVLQSRRFDGALERRFNIGIAADKISVKIRQLRDNILAADVAAMQNRFNLEAFNNTQRFGNKPKFSVRIANNSQLLHNKQRKTEK